MTDFLKTLLVPYGDTMVTIRWECDQCGHVDQHQDSAENVVMWPMGWGSHDDKDYCPTCNRQWWDAWKQQHPDAVTLA